MAPLQCIYLCINSVERDGFDHISSRMSTSSTSQINYLFQCSLYFVNAFENSIWVASSFWCFLMCIIGSGVSNWFGCHFYLILKHFVEYKDLNSSNSCILHMRHFLLSTWFHCPSDLNWLILYSEWCIFYSFSLISSRLFV